MRCFPIRLNSNGGGFLLMLLAIQVGCSNEIEPTQPVENTQQSEGATEPSKVPEITLDIGEPMASRFKELVQKYRETEVIYVDSNQGDRWWKLRLSVESVSFDVTGSGSQESPLMGTIKVLIANNANAADSNGVEFFKTKKEAIAASNWKGGRPVNKASMEPVAEFQWDGEKWEMKSMSPPSSWPFEPFKISREYTEILNEK